ncbi:MAG: hypothetical protein GY791_08420 [Alphaproteobacteria bacterium]|nr:hypothetical protein [Alphaproteobacteria bacterium]
MGVSFEFYWPGQTRKDLDRVYDEGGNFEEKTTYNAVLRFRFPNGFTEAIERLRERYQLGILDDIIQEPPNNFETGESTLPLVYKAPGDVAGAFERLAAALEARDPDAEGLVKSYVGFFGRVTNLPAVKINDEDWTLLQESIAGLAGQARWAEHQGIEGLYLAMYY